MNKMPTSKMPEISCGGNEAALWYTEHCVQTWSEI